MAVGRQAPPGLEQSELANLHTNYFSRARKVVSYCILTYLTRRGAAWILGVLRIRLDPRRRIPIVLFLRVLQGPTGYRCVRCQRPVRGYNLCEECASWWMGELRTRWMREGVN